MLGIEQKKQNTSFSWNSRYLKYRTYTVAPTEDNFHGILSHCEDEPTSNNLLVLN